MATGDLKGNLRKIEQGLRHLNYPNDVDYTGLAKGDPSVFLPIISYCFTSFSTRITELLVESGVELTAKNDFRFIEAVYKLLRDEFQYKPILSKQQFLHYGFAERKIQIVCDIISLVYKRHKELSNMKSQAKKRASSIKPQQYANFSNQLEFTTVYATDFQQGVSLTKEPEERSRNLISTCIFEDGFREVLEEGKTEAVCMGNGLDPVADMLDSVYEQDAPLTKNPEIECSSSLTCACIRGDNVREVSEEGGNKAVCVAYSLNSGADRLGKECEQNMKDNSNMEKLKSQIVELEEKLNKLKWVEDKLQALEEKLQGRIIVDEKDWNNLLSRVLLLETQLLLHCKKVDLSRDLNNTDEKDISANNVTSVSPDRKKEDLPDSLHQSSGYSSQLSAEPSPKATVINNHGLLESSKVSRQDTTIQRMERISKMIEETSELLKTSSNTS
nr:PREDICTED: centrosomal protein of 44 kDa isoform X2 [Anolis carolinensis]|eukprot:XP_016847976.1 PREDICTED: centrosomal protein of 44 kDa isoform X2 [Anolis carolinensis]